MSSLNDMKGRQFGRWTVIERVENYRAPCDEDGFCAAARWLCRCECGTEKVVLARNLISGRSKSCGCLRRELLKRRNSNGR